MNDQTIFNTEKAIYYGELADHDVRQAFREVRLEILNSQDKLRKTLPEGKINTLLHLVRITGEDSLRFDEEYTYHIAERLGVKRSELKGNWYYGLGYYVELLEEEIRKYRDN
jgi:hypothetical protein